MVIHLGDNQHNDKAGQCNLRLSHHKIGRIIILYLGSVGAGTVYHNQTEHGQKYHRKQQAVIIKTARFVFLFVRPVFRHLIPPRQNFSER